MKSACLIVGMLAAALIMGMEIEAYCALRIPGIVSAAYIVLFIVCNLPKKKEALRRGQGID